MVKVREITDKNEWEAFVLDRPEANFLHSWNWGEFYRNLGQEMKRWGWEKDSRLVGVGSAIIERAKRASYVVVPGGPLLDWSDKEAVEGFGETVKKFAKENKCSFVRVRPQILEIPENANLFSQLGFGKAPMHLHAELTHQLDLAGSEEELLAGMRKATRYEVKQAIKLGIKIDASQNAEEISEFYDLQMQTARRQGFVPFSRKFLQEQFRVFAGDNQCVLYTAWLGKMKLAQAMVMFYGREADYHYGASSEGGRKYPGAYLIQWEAIKEAKKRGMARYNLWGVAPEGERSHRFYGVSVFKRGFGGQDVAYLHARDLVLDWPGYAVNWGIEMVRKWMRKV